MLFTSFNFKIAKPIWLKDYEGEMNRTALFRASLPKGKGTVLHITAQNTYQVFINGKFVFFGPSRASHGYYRVDHLPIGKYLTEKENDISVLVSGYHCHNFYLVSELAFFVCEATSGENVFLATGTDAWESCLYTQNCKRWKDTLFSVRFARFTILQRKMCLKRANQRRKRYMTILETLSLSVRFPTPIFPTRRVYFLRVESLKN